MVDPSDVHELGRAGAVKANKLHPPPPPKVAKTLRRRQRQLLSQAPQPQQQQQQQGPTGLLPSLWSRLQGLHTWAKGVSGQRAAAVDLVASNGCSAAP